MKVIHFSKSDDKSAFLAAYRFHKQLLARGHDSRMLVAKKTRPDPEVVQVRLSLPEMWRMKLVRSISGKYIARKTEPRYYFYNYFEGFSYPVRAFQKSLPFSPDILMAHWVTGFINTKTLHFLQKKTRAPLVWRFNDMNPFTGGCHYSNGCVRYFDSCGRCPALRSEAAIDRSSKNLAAKIKWLGRTNVTFLSSTSEIDDQLKRSAIAKASKTKFIMLSLNAGDFKPAPDKDAAAVALGLPPGRKIVFFGAHSMKDPRKGFKEFVGTLRRLKATLAPELARQVLLVYSTTAENSELEWPFEKIRLPFIQGDGKLATAYNAATVLASPSIEDAGPMMLAESMLCGTPAVAFAIGLAKDAVIDNVTGFIANPLDCDQFARNLQIILEMDAPQAQALSKRCFSKATEMFSQEREMTEYEQLFENLVNTQ